MANFSAYVTSSNTISISSDTYWSCKAEGTFELSKYSGNGNDEIDVIFFDDITIANGRVIFSYGDGKCKYPDLTVFLNNNDYIETIPNYEICEGKRKINFFFDTPGETFYVSISCFDGWSVESHEMPYIISGNEIMLISTDDDSELQIKPQNNENIIYVKLIKKCQRGT